MEIKYLAQGSAVLISDGEMALVQTPGFFFMHEEDALPTDDDRLSCPNFIIVEGFREVGTYRQFTGFLNDNTVKTDKSELLGRLANLAGSHLGSMGIAKDMNCTIPLTAKVLYTATLTGPTPQSSWAILDMEPQGERLEFREKGEAYFPSPRRFQIIWGFAPPIETEADNLGTFHGFGFLQCGPEALMNLVLAQFADLLRTSDEIQAFAQSLNDDRRPSMVAAGKVMADFVRGAEELDREIETREIAEIINRNSDELLRKHDGQEVKNNWGLYSRGWTDGPRVKADVLADLANHAKAIKGDALDSRASGTHDPGTEKALELCESLADLILKLAEGAEVKTLVKGVTYGEAFELGGLPIPRDYEFWTNGARFVAWRQRADRTFWLRFSGSQGWISGGAPDFPLPLPDMTNEQVPNTDCLPGWLSTKASVTKAFKEAGK